MVITLPETASPSTPPPRQPIGNAVKYSGVWMRKLGKYVSEIRIPKSRKRIWLGTYDTAEKAARAFDAAQFCLRGHDANFNFPNDLPDIPRRRRMLEPLEIQSIAENHANSFFHTLGASSSQDELLQVAPELGEAAVESNLEGIDKSMDWSFLDVLELENDLGLSDFPFLPEPGEDDLYDVPLQFGCRGNDDDDNNESRDRR